MQEKHSLLPQEQLKSLRFEARVQLSLPPLLTLLSWFPSQISGPLFQPAHRSAPSQASSGKRSIFSRKMLSHFIHCSGHLGNKNPHKSKVLLGDLLALSCHWYCCLLGVEVGDFSFSHRSSWYWEWDSKCGSSLERSKFIGIFSRVST